MEVLASDQEIKRILKCIEDTKESSKKIVTPIQIQSITPIFENEDEKRMMFYLAKKSIKTISKTIQKSSQNIFLPPFEDGLVVTDLQESHRLVYNMFNIHENHLIVITKQFESQLEPLNKEDIKQTVFATLALNGVYFFNRGKQSGASIPHKHIQILPNSARSLPLFQALLQFANQHQHSNTTILQFPYFHFLHAIVPISADSHSNIISSTFLAYKLLHSSLISSLTEKGNPKNEIIQDYNIVGCQSFILLVPRRKERAFEEISVNGVGFMGSLLFKDAEIMKRYVQLPIKPSQILEDVTFSNQYYIPKSQKIVL